MYGMCFIPLNPMTPPVAHPAKPLLVKSDFPRYCRKHIYYFTRTYIPMYSTNTNGELQNNKDILAVIFEGLIFRGRQV